TFRSTARISISCPCSPEKAAGRPRDARSAAGSKPSLNNSMRLSLLEVIMAFKNRNAQKRIVKKPCELCGCAHVPRDAAHIIDEVMNHGVPGDWNALSLCPTCHRVFEESFRPRLFKALSEFGAVGLPDSWRRSNKLTSKSRGDSDE